VLNETYQAEIFTKNSFKGTYDAALPVNKHVYDYVINLISNI
jgi:hypothetical protein